MKTFKLITLAAAMALSGCSTVVNIPESEPAKTSAVSKSSDFKDIKKSDDQKVVVAVYGFTDKTGQRKPSEKLANISFAVTQGAEAVLIESLRSVGNGTWFTVVERVGLDNLTKERQIIRQARDSVNDTKQLKPMLYAGIILEGAIVGYDSNTLTGGAGARVLGIGPYTSYRQDVVTVTLRAVSVQTGEVLLSTSATKSIISTNYNVTYFRFLDQGTSAAEAEIGYSVNEPVTYAVKTAIDQTIVDLIKQGAEKNYWAVKNNTSN